MLISNKFCICTATSKTSNSKTCNRQTYCNNSKTCISHRRQAVEKEKEQEEKNKKGKSNSATQPATANPSAKPAATKPTTVKPATSASQTTKPAAQSPTKPTKTTTNTSNTNHNSTSVKTTAYKGLGGISPINVNIKETYGMPNSSTTCITIKGNRTLYKWSDGKLIEMSNCYKSDAIEDHWQTEKFFYDKNNRIEKVEVSPKAEISSHTKTFIYENNKLVKITNSPITAGSPKAPDLIKTTTSQRTFKYQGDKISETVYTSKETSVAYGTTTIESKMTFVWEGDNVKKITETEFYKSEDVSHTTTYIHEYTYDNKLNPYYCIYDGSVLSADVLSKNNVISSKSTRNNASMGTSEYTYEYNAKNVPIESYSNSNPDYVYVNLY